MKVIESLLQDVELCVYQERWHGALFIALSIPDICSNIAGYKTRYPSERYAKWCANYLHQHLFFTMNGLSPLNLQMEPSKNFKNLRTAYEKHTSNSFFRKADEMMWAGIELAKPEVFGKNLYALRCSVLHEGTSVTKKQATSSLALERFFLFKPVGLDPYNLGRVLTIVNNEVYHLGIVRLCFAIYCSVMDWLATSVSSENMLDNEDLIR